jgi:hypothetical protein
VEVRVVDAGDPTKFDDIKHFVDNTPTVASLSYSKTVSSASEGEDKYCRLVRYLFSHVLRVLVSRCTKRGTRLLPLVAEATSIISRFRMFKDPRAPPVWIRVPI